MMTAESDDAQISLLRHKQFALYWVTRVLSTGGYQIISVAIDSKPDGAAQRLTKGVLVKSGSLESAAWAIEVSQVRALVEVSPVPVAGVADHPERASFVSWRKTRDDGLVGWVDVARMIAELSQGRTSNVAS